MAFLTGQSWRVHLFTGGGPKQGLNESLVSSVAQFSPSLFKTTQCWGSCSVRSFLLVVFVCLFFVLFVSFGATSFVSAPLRWSFLNSYPYWCRFACYWKYRVFVVFALLVLLLSFFPLGARESVPGTGTKWLFCWHLEYPICAHSQFTLSDAIWKHDLSNEYKAMDCSYTNKIKTGCTQGPGSH